MLQGETPTEKTGQITSLKNSVKQKLSNPNPEGKQKNEEVSDHPSNIISPDCKNQIRYDGDVLACSTSAPQRPPPLALTHTDRNTQPLDTSSNYDTDNEVQPSGLTKANKCTDDRAACLLCRTSKKKRVGQIKHICAEN